MLRDIPDELYRRLKDEAEARHRSLNREVIHRLERSVRAPSVDPEAHLDELEELQRRLDLPPLGDEDLRRARTEGRP